MLVELIYSDCVWWQQQMKQLRELYFNAVLPELRHGKGGIREPHHRHKRRLTLVQCSETYPL